MMTFSEFSYRMRIIIHSCGIKDMEGIDDFVDYSYRKYLNSNNKETEKDKSNRHLFQRIILLISLRHKYNEYVNLITNNYIIYINMDKKELKKLVLDLLEKAIKQVYATDRDVITNKVSERCVCARLAFHLENIMRASEYRESFLGYFVDVEYDRMADANPKHIVGEKRHVCDLLIHSRGHKNPDNLLALEMKVHDNNTNVTCDLCRLTHIVQSSDENSP